MATEANLTAINIFPSYAEYEKNKASLPATDISLVPKDTTLEKTLHFHTALANAVMSMGSSEVEYRDLIYIKSVVTNSTELNAAKTTAKSLPDTNIYDTSTGDLWKLSGSAYVNSGKYTASDLLPNSLIFNPNTKKLFYVDRSSKIYNVIG